LVNFRIYSAHVSNDYASIAPVTESAADAMREINNRSLLAEWGIVDYEFQIIDGGKVTALPDIYFMYGKLVFRGELKGQIFPTPCNELEFLPIRVAGENWFLLNCLKTTLGYDSDESIFYRSLEGQIFLINHLVVSDATLPACEVFVIDDSNRTTLFVLPSFVERIGRLNLGGITFKEIGFLLS
jgi:hypothetical protein